MLLSAAPPPSPAAPPSQVTLEIHHLWDGRPLTIPGGDLPRAHGDTLTFTRLAYLLSNPRVQVSAGFQPAVPPAAGPSGSEWLQRADWFAFVDGTDGVSRIALAGLPRGRYSALQFHIGLDDEPNRSDPSRYPPDHPLNPVRNNLHWSWLGEYIFLAVEGRAGDTGFVYHLGNAPLRMTIVLPLDLDLAVRDAIVALDFHLDRVFEGDTPVDIAAQTSTHGRDGDALAVSLKNRIENAFTLREVRPVDRPQDPAPKASPDRALPPLVGTPYAFPLRKGFPVPALPVDYPMTAERVALGNKLFHDPILSRSNTISCATCHDRARAFADERRFSAGEGGRESRRNAMPLFNLAWKSSFFWDGRAPSLRAQALVPIEDPVEMHETLAHVEGELAARPQYPPLFESAFGDENVTAERLAIALEQFVLTLTSFDSRFDRAASGGDALTAQEQRGFELFFTEYDPRRGLLGADCFHCHGGAFFTDHRFHNNGLAPTGDRGLGEFTGKESDRGKFATPSLRNVALTAPYMHDGRFATLEAVLDHYTSGVQHGATLDPNLLKHPGGGIPLADADKAAIVAFLETLTDEKFSPREEPASPGGSGARPLPNAGANASAR